MAWCLSPASSSTCGRTEWQPSGFGVGAKMSAKGQLRMTVLGTRMLEANHANGYDIE